MHELSLAAALIEQCQEELLKSNGSTIHSITVGVGGLSGVEPEALQFCFSTVAEGSSAAGAVLKIRKLPIQVLCRACQQQEEIDAPLMLCSHCGNSDLEITQGMDFLLLEMEIE